MTIPAGWERPRTLSLRAEWWWLAAILAAFLAINVLTASRSPTVWIDEAMFADPAASVVMGQGLHSTAWKHQRLEEIWSGNAPLHTWVLIPWIKAFGLNVVSVRSINYVYAAVSAALIWVAVRRAKVVQRPGWRLALVVLLLCENGISFSYRSGRYDMIGMLFVSAALAALTIRRPAPRLTLLALIGLPVAFAGNQLVPAAVIGMAVALVLWRGKIWREALVMIVAVTIGGLSYYVYLQSVDGWRILLLTLPSRDMTMGDRFYRLWDAVGGILNVNRRNGAFNDYSLLPIMLVGTVGLLAGRNWAGRRVSAVCLAVSSFAPAVMAFMGHFPSYYAWIVAIPACVAAISGGEAVSVRAGRRGALALGLVLMVAASLGLPARLAVVARTWRARDPAPMEAFVASHLRATDVIVADYQFFYPVRRSGLPVYFAEYVPRMTEKQKDFVTVVVSAGPAKEFLPDLAGKWRLDDTFAVDGNAYSVRVYRREP